MAYEKLSASKKLLADLYHKTDWLNIESNIALWEIFYKSYDFGVTELLSDIEVLELYSPRDVAFFVNAHATGATSKLKSEHSHYWLSEYKKWVLRKNA